MRRFLFLATIMIIGVIYLALFIIDISAWTQYQSLDLPTRAEVLKSFVEAMAIVIAGLWTYEIYIKNRYDHPYPKIQQQIKYFHLGNDFNYLSVFVTVTNEGKTKLNMGSGYICIRRVLPLVSNIKELIAKTGIDNIRKGANITQDNNTEKLFIDKSQRVGWLTIGERTWKQDLRKNMLDLEQTREIQFDFLFNDKVDVVEVLSYFEYKRSRWEHTTLHTLKCETDSVNMK
jgi:hypothetical protein